MKKEKEKFLNYCVMFKNELADLQKSLDEDEFLTDDYCCTLAYLGLNYSYELANIGFELGYSGWTFNNCGGFDDIKKDFLTMIMENENIIGCYTEEELNKIEKRILKCKENK